MKLAAHNNLINRLILFTVIIAFASCTPATKKVEYRPSRNYVTASWYGPQFHGKATSSGERYDMYGLTAAHKTLVFGTRLRVTNPDNSRSVVVTVNDRGPFIRGRDLDLSYGAAKAIGLTQKGVGRVRIEYLGRNMRYVKRVAYQPSMSPGPFTVQVGSFSDSSRAKRLKRGLDLNYRNIYIKETVVDGEIYYRVRIGRFSRKRDAESIAEKLADEGYPTLITSKDL